MSTLILKRASASRSSGTWKDSDFDVLGRWVVVAPHLLSRRGWAQDSPWMWASGHNGDIRRAAHGYEPKPEAAMAAEVARRKGTVDVLVAYEQTIE
jgi:hypothetical protein